MVSKTQILHSKPFVTHQMRLFKIKVTNAPSKTDHLLAVNEIVILIKTTVARNRGTVFSSQSLDQYLQSTIPFLS